jgi:hypothetical protein
MRYGKTRHIAFALAVAMLTGAIIGLAIGMGDDVTTHDPATESENGPVIDPAIDPVNETPEPIYYRDDGGPGFHSFHQTWNVEPNWTRILIRFTILSNERSFITASTDTSASLTINDQRICSPSNGITTSDSPAHHVLYVEKTRHTHEGNCNGTFDPGRWTLETETGGTTGDWIREFIVEY